MENDKKTSLIFDPDDSRPKTVSDSIFDNRISLDLILKLSIFNEREAAMYLRTGIETIRYHALRSRKLKYARISKNGLVFRKQDLDELIDNSVIENHRDS